MIFNLIVLRQVIGLIFLSTVPGYFIVKLLKLDLLSRLEIALFSVAASLACIMFLGLVVNTIGPLAGIPNPLSLTYLLAALSGLFLCLFAIAYKTSKPRQGTDLLGKITIRSFVLALSLVALCLSGIIGALYNNISILIIMLVGVAFLGFVCAFFDNVIPERFLPLIIVAIAITLLFHTVLISKHFLGSDVFSEFYVFKLTDINGYWQTPGTMSFYSLTDSLNSVLSITILPKVYTVLLGISGELFFKIFYPLIFSLLPLSIYTLTRRQLNARISFLSAFFFMSLSIAFFGLEPLSLSRQIIGEFFFVLSFFVIIERKHFSNSGQRVLLIILVSGLTLSHYSLAFMFLFFNALFFFLPRLWAILHGKARTTTMQHLTIGVFLLLISIVLFWYTFVSNSPLNQLTNAFERISNFFTQDFFRPESRTSQGVLTSLSPIVASSLAGTVHKILIYLGQAFIVIGVLIVAVKPKRFNVSSGFRLLGISSIAILGLVFAIPNLYSTLNTSRFYAIVLPFLSPFLALGACFIFDSLINRIEGLSIAFKKVNISALGVKVATCVVVLTFLFQVGLINHLTYDYPFSYSLDLDRKFASQDISVQATVHSLYFLDTEVASAEWLLINGNQTAIVHADTYAQDTVLRSYALRGEYMLPITNETFLSGSYTYLKYINVNLGLVEATNSTNLASALNYSSKIYSNGDSDIYFTP